MEKDNLIKQVKSCCPECMTEIKAGIFEENGKAVMRKECPDHGKFESIIENDVEIYKRILEKNPGKEIKRCLLMIPVTYKCNSNCKFCYMPYVENRELSDDQIKEYIDNPNYLAALFTGGEPTMHPRLPDFIDYAHTLGKGTCIVTNGLKLAEMPYIKELKNKGLDIITFSLNAMDDNIYIKYLDRQPVLDRKLKALKNIKKLKITTLLSWSWMRGINDQEFKKIFKLALRNNDFINEIRCRIYSSFGRHESTQATTLSDFIKMLAEVTDIPVEEYLEHWLDLDFPPHPFLFRIDYCRFIKSRKIAQKLKSSIFTYPAYVIYLVKYFGLVNVIGSVFNFIRRKKQMPLVIQIFSWPDPYRADIDDLKYFEIDHVAINGSINTFFETMILNEKIHKHIDA